MLEITLSPKSCCGGSGQREALQLQKYLKENNIVSNLTVMAKDPKIHRPTFKINDITFTNRDVRNPKFLAELLLKLKPKELPNV